MSKQTLQLILFTYNIYILLFLFDVAGLMSIFPVTVPELDTRFRLNIKNLMFAIVIFVVGHIIVFAIII